MYHENKLKNKNIIFTLLLSASCSIMASQAVAQSPTEMTQAESDRNDSLKVSHDAEVRSQAKQDKENLSDLKSERSDTRTKAREARRIEGEANDAARESRTAYRSEKKAQKARLQADKQSKKAAKARSISNDN